MSTNDITGHRLVTRVAIDDNYQSNYDRIFKKKDVPLGEDTRPKDRVKLGLSPSTIVENWNCTSEGELCDDQDCPVHETKPQF